MQNRPPQGAWDGEQAQMLIAFCAVLLLCWLFFDLFVYWTSWTLYWVWKMADFSVVHAYAAPRVNLLAELANNAKVVSFDEWLKAMNHTSGILLVFLLPLVVMSGLGLATHPALPFRSKRMINIHTLPGVVSAFAPSVIPVLAASGPDGLMNDTSTANAWALKPEEFAEQHRLIQRKVLDQDAARVVFEAQIGAAHDGLQDWQPHERALLAVFGSQVFLNDRKTATALLDDLNRSCLVKGFLRRKHYSMTPIYRLADKTFARLAQTPQVSEWLQDHVSVRSALAALYGQDLRLPSARYRWLKGVDRTLWYALHSADTAKGYIEGAGVLAQARAETHAKKLGLPRPDLMVHKAVEGLQIELEGIGLVHAQEIIEAKPREASDVPVMTAVYAAEPVPADESDAA